MSNWAKLQEDLMGKPVFKRAKHGIHFQNNDGSITANFSGKPCHYLDAGLWKPIDTKLILLPDGFYGCPHSPVKVHPDGRVAVTGTDYLQRVELPSAKTGLADGDKLIREFSFGKQEMRITEDGFRSEITLNRIPTLTEARKLIASESGTLTKEYLKSLTTATDANGSMHTLSTLTAFRTWLASAKFPVVIDPDFAGSTTDLDIVGQHADYATARATSSGTGNDARYRMWWRLAAGVYYVGRAFTLFNTSSIGADSTVTQVNLSMVAYGAAGAGNIGDIQIVKYDWSEFAADTGNATKRETAYDGCLSGTADDSIWHSDVLTANTRYDSGNLSTAWVSKTGTTYYGLRGANDYIGTGTPTGENYENIYSQDSTTEGFRPILKVTYTASGIAIPVAQYYYNRLRRN